MFYVIIFKFLIIFALIFKSRYCLEVTGGRESDKEVTLIVPDSPYMWIKAEKWSHLEKSQDDSGASMNVLTIDNQ